MQPVHYPAGTCVRTAKGSYLINSDGKRYRFISEQARESWNHALTVITTELALEKYPLAVTRLPYRDGSLLNNIADGKMYIVSAGKLRHVVSTSVLERLGITKADFVDTSLADINSMKHGEDIY